MTGDFTSKLAEIFCIDSPGKPCSYHRARANMLGAKIYNLALNEFVKEQTPDPSTLLGTIPPPRKPEDNA